MSATVFRRLRHIHLGSWRFRGIRPIGFECHFFRCSKADCSVVSSCLDLLKAHSVDSAGRVTSVQTPWHTTDVTYASATGQVSSVRRGGRQVAFQWDGPLLTNEATTGLSTVGFAYDADFRVSALAIDGVSTPRSYDADGLLTSVGPVQLARSPSSGRLVSTTVGPVTTTYGYSQYGEVQTVTTSVSGAVLYTQGLQYDAVGNPLGSEETLSGAARQESYQHDAVGRLTSVTRNGVTTMYAYGPNSTRVRAGADVATFDAQDRVLAQGRTTYTWDVHGNRATDSTGVTYTHDGLGRLTGWRKGTTSLAYEVDALDRRVLRRRNGVVTARYVYEGQYRVVAELESGSRFLYATHGHSPDAMVRGGVTYVYVKNHLGSVRAVVNGNTGQVVQALDYDVWGSVVSDTSPGFQPFGFAGGLYDAESKLTHFGWRDYDATTGTWTSKDPIRQAGGLNVYLYVNASPTRYVDPSGKFLGVLLAALGELLGPALAGVVVADGAAIATAGAVGVAAGAAVANMSSGGGPASEPLPTAGMPLPAPGPGLPEVSPRLCEGGGGISDRDCSEHYNRCMDAHVSSGVPRVSDCVECQRICNSGGCWPWIREGALSNRYLCDYTNPGYRPE
jgi:RHS repeat-associated protein